MGFLENEPFYVNLTTLILHAGTFLVLLMLLKYVLFDPLLRVIQERRRKIEEGDQSIEEKRARLSEKIEEFERRMEAEREEATREMQNIVSEGEEKRSEIMSDAHEKALEILNEARAEVEKEKEQALEQIRDQTSGIAAQIAGEVTEHGVERAELHEFIQDAS